MPRISRPDTFRQRPSAQGAGLRLALWYTVSTAGQILARWLTMQPEGVWITLGIALGGIAIAAFIWPCMVYAERKGYSPALGFLGLLNIVGLVILLVLPFRRA